MVPSESSQCGSSSQACLGFLFLSAVLYVYTGSVNQRILALVLSFASVCLRLPGSRDYCGLKQTGIVIGIMALLGSLAKRGASLIEESMLYAGRLKCLLRQTLEKYALYNGSLLIKGDSWV